MCYSCGKLSQIRKFCKFKAGEGNIGISNQDEMKEESVSDGDSCLFILQLMRRSLSSQYQTRE